MTASDEITTTFYFDSDQLLASSAAGWWKRRSYNSPTRKRFRKAQRMAWRRLGIVAIHCTRIVEK